MNEFFRTRIKNHTTRIMLILQAILVSTSLYSQDTLTNETGLIKVYHDDYKNGMHVTWDLDVGDSKVIIFHYDLGLSETTIDYINIYEVDDNNNSFLIGTFSGNDTGEIRTTNKTGKARIEFISDGSDCYYDGNYSLSGFVIAYRLDGITYARNNMEVKYNAKIKGNLEIGTRTPSANSQLLVKGKIKARNVEMTTNGWADYVFDQNYKLPTLTYVEQYIDTHKHLPGIPSAADVKENGVKIADMQIKLLQKIEELTLYLIQHQKDIDGLKEK